MDVIDISNILIMKHTSLNAIQRVVKVMVNCNHGHISLFLKKIY